MSPARSFHRWARGNVLRGGSTRATGARQLSLGGDGCLSVCLSVVFQAMQSLRKAISSSSCDLPATVKEVFDVTECCHAIGCLN